MPKNSSKNSNESSIEKNEACRAEIIKKIGDIKFKSCRKFVQSMQIIILSPPSATRSITIYQQLQYNCANLKLLYKLGNIN